MHQSMKSFITAFFILSSVFLEAQEFTLENKWLKGSSQLFYGVPNYLIIKGEVDSITKFTSNAGIQRQHDTLLIYPGAAKVLITLYTSRGKSTYEYEAVNFPAASLEFVCRDFNKTAKSVIIQPDSTDHFFSNYSIVQYTVTVAGKKLAGNSNYLTSAVIDAINKAANGSKISFPEIIFWNKETEQYITQPINSSWSINHLSGAQDNRLTCPAADITADK